MRVLAKFYVSSIQHLATPGSEPVAQVTLNAIYGSFPDGADDQNAQWSKATPNGKIEMTITNPAAIDAFEAGQPYIVEFRTPDRRGN